MKISMRFTGAFSALLIGGLVLQMPAIAETIAVIGTGNVGSTLGPEFGALGHKIVYGSREPGRDDVRALVARTPNGSATTQREAVAGADVVVLAVPGAAAEEVTRSLSYLSGEILIDPTNRVGRENGVMIHDVPGKGSNAALIQAAAPGAKVVKAFNTLNVAQMADPETAGGPITIMLAGDDADAKAFVATLVEGMGLHAVDVGPLVYANTLEEMLVLWANSLRTDHSFNYYLRPMPQN